MTKDAILLIIPANLPGETGASPWNRHAKPGSEREMELLLKTCAVSAFYSFIFYVFILYIHFKLFSFIHIFIFFSYLFIFIHS